ncbi:MAG: hypothetical protein QM702_00070 [Rubrivivax sp.]
MGIESRMDRGLQRRILERLRDLYPAQTTPDSLGLGANDDPAWVFNAAYLAEHELIEAKVSRMSGGGSQLTVIGVASITARGLDFIEADGGLSAVLGVVTVRLEAETLKALIERRVEASDLPPEQKSALMKKLQEMGSDALKEVTKRLVGGALDHWPAALQQVQTLLG